MMNTPVERRARLSPLSLCLALLLVSCGDDKPEPVPEAHVQDEDPEADGEPADFEGCPSSTPEFALGMQAHGMFGNIHATLIDASKVPPERYLNDWTVELTNSDGEPLEDVTIRSARPFMPVHGHDGNVKPTVKAAGEPGRFTLTGLNLQMRGPWEIQLQLRSASAGDDYVVFEICVEE